MNKFFGNNDIFVNRSPRNKTGLNRINKRGKIRFQSRNNDLCYKFINSVAKTNRTKVFYGRRVRDFGNQGKVSLIDFRRDTVRLKTLSNKGRNLLKLFSFFVKYYQKYDDSNVRLNFENSDFLEGSPLEENSSC